ncbi:MAG TPA: hypothetical protein VGR51_00180 [Thermoplasmata archaeon]|nr:hypothetical protein [Thermoplasmata archaeon]
MAETQWKAAQARWASTTTALSRMPLWRLAMVIGVLLAVAAAVAVLLQTDNGNGNGNNNGGPDMTPAVYNLVLAGIGFVGFAVSRQSVLNGSIVAAVAGIGLVLVGGGQLALLGGLALLLGAVWAYATTRQPAPQPLYPPRAP